MVPHTNPSGAKTEKPNNYDFIISKKPMLVKKNIVVKMHTLNVSKREKNKILPTFKFNLQFVIEIDVIMLYNSIEIIYTGEVLLCF